MANSSWAVILDGFNNDFVGFVGLVMIVVDCVEREGFGLYQIEDI